MTPAEVAKRYNLSPNTAKKALSSIQDHKVIFLAISGRIGSGKDTVAPLLVSNLGFPNAEHTSFAKPLRDEVNQVIDLILKSKSLDDAIRQVQIKLNPVNFEVVVEALYQDVKNGIVKNAYDRTPSTRKALQWWGTEVRRSVDQDYWVKKAMAESLTKLARGVSIYVTDSRFPNEADCVLSVGGSVVRLHVSPEEQARRIKSRDGQEPNLEALSHVSEIAMDTYLFPIEINTDVMQASEVASAAAEQILATWDK